MPMLTGRVVENFQQMDSLNPHIVFPFFHHLMIHIAVVLLVKWWQMSNNPSGAKGLDTAGFGNPLHGITDRTRPGAAEPWGNGLSFYEVVHYSQGKVLSGSTIFPGMLICGPILSLCWTNITKHEVASPAHSGCMTDSSVNFVLR